MRGTVLTFGVGGAGAAVFALLGVPLPLLLGPMFAGLLAALAGVEMTALPKLSDAMRTILGVAVGTSITPAVIDRLGEMAASIALLPLFILVLAGTGYPWYRRAGFDGATAYYAAVPGGFQDMLLYGEEAGGSVRVLSLVHATRVLVVVTAMPLLFTLLLGERLDSPPGAPAADLPPLEGALMIAIAVLGWRGAKGGGGSSGRRSSGR